MDGAALSLDEIKQIFSLPSKLIATCRPNPAIRGEEERKKTLLTAIEAGAAYVDIEIEAADDFKKEIMQTARLRGCRVILSYHNYDKTPPKSEPTKIAIIIPIRIIFLFTTASFPDAGYRISKIRQ